jgi:CDP-glucose 4,6-dehydratase
LVEKSISSSMCGEWNFGPDLNEKYSVSALASEFANKYQIKGDAWKAGAENQPHESNYLLLDSEKARKNLNWKEKLNFQESVAWTAEWYINAHVDNVREYTLNQIKRYFEL